MEPPLSTDATGVKVIELSVKRKTEGLRVDQYLATLFPEHSRSVVQKVIESGAVTVNGRPVKASYKVRFEDRVRVELPTSAPVEVTPEDIPLEVLYEDEFLALINKPPDMVVHPARGNWGGTLVNALAFHFQHLSTVNGLYRPGIVHRLDRDTSGVILVAKEEQTHRELAMQFENRKIFKEYLTITAGVLDRDSDYIEGRIGRHRHDRVKMAVIDDEEDELAKDACTYYEVVERFRSATFCRVHPKTGRTHQIRVHLASVGCPVLADKVYSGRDKVLLSDMTELHGREDEVLLARQALHAHRLRFEHPRARRIVEVTAPLPSDFQNTLTAFRRHRPWP
jgi:23S rRNA pseudouridine1911/1915/1917 synthase